MPTGEGSMFVKWANGLMFDFPFHSESSVAPFGCTCSVCADTMLMNHRAAVEQSNGLLVIASQYYTFTLNQLQRARECVGGRGGGGGGETLLSSFFPSDSETLSLPL